MVVDKPMETLVASASLRLGELYPGVKVYAEAIKQHLPDKSFVLFCVPGLNRKVSATRYQMTGNLDIAYIIRDDSDEAYLKKEFAEVYQNISTGMNNLEYQGSRLRLTDFSYQEQDNVLHILGSYEIQYFVEEDDNG